MSEKLIHLIEAGSTNPKLSILNFEVQTVLIEGSLELGKCGRSRRQDN